MTATIINNEFEQQLVAFGKEAEDIQKQEQDLMQKNQMFSEKLQGFLREHGLPKNFTIPQLALLAIRKARV